MARFTVEGDVDELIAQMDLKEKISLLTGVGSSAMTGLERLGILALMVESSSLLIQNIQLKLIAAVLHANHNTIVVTQSGCPIEMPWINSAKTLVHALFGGQETGHGLTDILFGHVNPAGRLSLTFPKSLKQAPAYLTFGKVDRDIMYGEGVFIGHRYYEKLEQEPLFYFGYGLSYSTFEYSELHAPSTFEGDPDNSIDVSVDIKNLGPYDDAEVVQIYIQDIDSTLQRPVRELKAFKKIKLANGEQARVKIALDKYSLSFWSEEASKWKAEAGDYNIIVATSADPKDEKLRTTFTLTKTFFWSGL